jgi:hypothetical protein
MGSLICASNGAATIGRQENLLKRQRDAWTRCCCSTDRNVMLMIHPAQQSAKRKQTFVSKSYATKASRKNRVTPQSRGFPEEQPVIPNVAQKEPPQSKSPLPRTS